MLVPSHHSLSLSLSHSFYPSLVLLLFVPASHRSAIVVNDVVANGSNRRRRDNVGFVSTKEKSEGRERMNER